jgi:hypothetical protein
MFVQPTKTIVSSSTKSMKWISRVPCKVLSQTNTHVTLQPYDACKLEIPIEIFEQYFEQVEVSDEFKQDFDVQKIALAKVCKLINTIDNVQPALLNNIHIVVKKAFQDAYCAAGDQKTINIEDYISKKYENVKLNTYSPYFNRRARHCCVVPDCLCLETFSKDPAPVGIRKVDFASKSEQNKVFVELIKQLFAFANMPLMPKELHEYLEIQGTICPGTHKCRYCGCVMDILKVEQKYSVKTTYLNLCHHDPQDGTKASNVYWGHTTCNREQGGFTLQERAMQGIRILKNLLSSSHFDLNSEYINELKDVSNMINKLDL